jgi:hypothetical protein
MFGKILLTAAVIAAAVLVLRLRSRRGVPATVSPAGRGPGGLMGWLAVGVIALMLVGAALMFYLEWRADDEIVDVRVIDAGSGQVSSYRVRRGDVDERSFVTVDGRRVVLAETERLEMLER